MIPKESQSSRLSERLSTKDDLTPAAHRTALRPREVLKTVRLSARRPAQTAQIPPRRSSDSKIVAGYRSDPQSTCEEGRDRPAAISVRGLWHEKCRRSVWSWTPVRATLLSRVLVEARGDGSWQSHNPRRSDNAASGPC
jgi:hypothetical protein